MSRWFRLYDEILDDPKVQKLPPDLFKSWINILAICSRNNGILPPISDCAFVLREPENAIETVVERLLNAGLIEKCNGGVNGWHYAPHNWSKRQYKSDTSSERVKRFRGRSKPVTETPPETDTEADTEADTDASVSGDKIIDEFWDAYPKKVGRGALFSALDDALKKTTPEILLSAVRAFAVSQKGTEQQFIPHPTKWLDEERWLDHKPTVDGQPVEQVVVMVGTDEWRAWCEYQGRPYPTTDIRTDAGFAKGWYFPSKLPPEKKKAKAA